MLYPFFHESITYWLPLSSFLLLHLEVLHTSPNDITPSTLRKLFHLSLLSNRPLSEYCHGRGGHKAGLQ